MFDRQDYIGAAGKRGVPDKASDIVRLQAFERAALDAGAVTGSAEWDVFLSYIQAEIARLDGLIAQTIEAQGDESLVSHDEIMRLKIQRHGLQKAKITLQAVVELPSDIIKNGEKARSIRERLGD